MRTEGIQIKCFTQIQVFFKIYAKVWVSGIYDHIYFLHTLEILKDV